MTRRKNPERSKRILVVGFGLFMIALMLFSIVEVVLYNPATSGETPLIYGEHEFVLETRASGGQVLVTTLNGQEVEFQNLPVQVQYLEVDPAAITLIKNAAQVALTVDPTLPLDQLSLIDYSRLQLMLATQKTVNAVDAQSDLYAQPVITCDQASAQMPVMRFVWTNETATVTTDGYCITVAAADRELMRAKDRIIFEYHDILQQGQLP